MTGTISMPRYSHDDFETASIRSAAPSYVSEAPSYHSTAQHSDSAPPYAPRAAAPTTSAPARNESSTPRPRTIGLPPIPPIAPQSAVALPNFRIPTWSANNAPAARHYRNVAERRITDGRYLSDSPPARRYGGADRTIEHQTSAAAPATSTHEVRPLEDPYLVGEVAAAQARRERLARESGDDVLLREDRQWDWLLVQMKSWDERERSWARFRRDLDNTHRKKLLHRIGGRLLS
ncbi:methyltransferase type 12 [Purpureocillium lavendulum]|uniref:Methyltransferase type 12 n=1 Tax=Purpureocillium lavendulum TaxID=1247861 RepID=A0AB34FYQ2_9HYPO|nr:methyltransferase type 12 [Purpureocillium lavendulum]